MKILMIIPFIPYPLDSGGNQAFFSMVNYLKDTHDISLLFPAVGRDKDKVRNLEQALDGKVRIYTHSAPGRVAGSLVGLGTYMNVLSYVHASSGRKMQRWIGRNFDRIVDKPEQFKMASQLYMDMPDFSDDFMQFIYELCERERFDCIQVEFFNCFPFKMLFPPKVKTVFVEHEIQFVRIANEMSLFGEVTWHDRVLSERKKNEELAELASFDKIITLTETDRKILSEYLPADRISVSPAVISKKDRVLPFKECGVEFVYVGGAQHTPNLDAMIWFCNEIIPVLRERNFTFRLYVVGQWGARLVKAFKKKCPEVEFTGYIGDLEAFLNGRISLVPVRIGSGMRIKILEAIHSMSPFITTTKGVEGQDFRDGEECLVCDTAETFASAMMSLAADKGLQEKLAGQALAKLHGSYDNSELLQRRARFYQELAEELPVRE